MSYETRELLTVAIVLMVFLVPVTAVAIAKGENKGSAIALSILIFALFLGAVAVGPIF